MRSYCFKMVHDQNYLPQSGLFLMGGSDAGSRSKSKSRSLSSSSARRSSPRPQKRHEHSSERKKKKRRSPSSSSSSFSSASPSREKNAKKKKQQEVKKLKRIFDSETSEEEEMQDASCSEDVSEEEGTTELATELETTDEELLIRGDGEILKEIVSKERHKEINKVQVFQKRSVNRRSISSGPHFLLVSHTAVH
ncbi:ADP-ribosylation factor-like protein 6-interacting protein 4 [Carassius gibelio]|uniref:ADP-ribosylation factor-like protein 6-interacting protein 4 n=1 Tax=Carassius gibelio TaxID=101364 RepID=UPI00227842B3|nr:ADP-ribosylation factor-like protein 6-interacting protein 4 [Carassius gibelio]